MTHFLAGIVGQQRAVWMVNAFERLCKTFAQTFITLMTASGLGIKAFEDLGFVQSSLAAAGAACLSLIMSWITAWATNDKSNTAAVPVPARA